MRSEIVTTGLAFMVAAFWLLSSALPCAAQVDDPVGSEWVYSFQQEYLNDVEYTGTWTFSCEKIVDCPLGQEHRKAAEYHSVFEFERTGLGYGSNWDWHMIISEKQFYDVNTSDLIGTVSNEHIEERNTLGSAAPTYSYDERNETIYTPPGGSGNAPENIEPGDSWTETSTKISNVSGYENGVYFAKDFSWTETQQYTYIGVETITVPAGSFTCNKYQIVSSDGWTETDWWAPGISSYAQIEDAYGPFEVLTYELTSYHLESNSGGGTVEMGSDLFVGGFFALVVATTVAAAYASIVIKEGKKHPIEESDEDIRRS